MIFYATVPSMEVAVGLSLKVLSIIPDNSEQIMFYLVREKRVWIVEVKFYMLGVSFNRLKAFFARR